MAAIRALRVLDPGGVVLELVCEPVRAYLRTRDDTVRCIVQSLIDDSNSELADELKQNEGDFAIEAGKSYETFKMQVLATGISVSSIVVLS